MTKRPTGVVVAAVLLGAMALMLTVGGVGVLLTSAFVHPPIPQNAAAVHVTLAILGIFFLGLAAFGWWVMAGLLRTRNWARISVVILGALLALVGLGFASLLLLIRVGSLSNLPPSQSAPAFLTGAVVSYVLLAALGVWWIVYFNLRPVRAVFTGHVLFANSASAGVWNTPALTATDNGMSAARVLVVIYAILGGFGALAMIVFSTFQVPLFLLGIIFRGQGAFLVYLLFAALQIFICTGVFRRVRSAYYVAIAMQVLGVCSAFIDLLPSVQPRFLLYRQEIFARMHLQGPALAPPGFESMQRAMYGYYVFAGAVLCGIFVWGLLRDLSSLPRADANSAEIIK